MCCCLFDAVIFFSYIYIYKGCYALGKGTVFILMINAWSLKILLQLQQLHRKFWSPPPQVIFCMYFNEEFTIFMFWKLFSVSVTRKFTNQISVEILLQNLTVSVPTQFATIPTLHLIHCYVHALNDSFTEYALCNVSPSLNMHYVMFHQKSRFVILIGA
jgi:hypothetical protein